MGRGGKSNLLSSIQIGGLLKINKKLKALRFVSCRCNKIVQKLGSIPRLFANYFDILYILSLIKWETVIYSKTCRRFYTQTICEIVLHP